MYIYAGFWVVYLLLLLILIKFSCWLVVIALAKLKKKNFILSNVLLYLKKRKILMLPNN